MCLLVRVGHIYTLKYNKSNLCKMLELIRFFKNKYIKLLHLITKLLKTINQKACKKNDLLNLLMDNYINIINNMWQPIYVHKCRINLKHHNIIFNLIDHTICHKQITLTSKKLADICKNKICIKIIFRIFDCENLKLKELSMNHLSQKSWEITKWINYLSQIENQIMTLYK